MYFGADYYPEHWTKERWAVDAKLMKEAGLNVVRLAEFAWSKIETVEGIYDFVWLDEATEIFSELGIKIVLGTPTAAPPYWLMDKYPDIYQTDRYGIVKKFGSRRHYCANNMHFHEYSQKIAEEMAKHYQGNDNIVAWQIDNEFGCHGHICYCENCKQSFQQWLSIKYEDIEALNKEWGTIFWSQTYNSFKEVIVPAYTQCDGDSEMSGKATHNPGLLLDYMRFQSDAIIKYQKLQIDIIRQYSDQPITHNLMGHFSELDYYGLGRDLDFISWDNYITFQWGTATYEKTSMAHDMWRRWC
ncbi:MAG: beta-galactosidase [Vallitaleaceae bacterium]|nr:beta-galactosidase [Vallitaleaceae bacterium]